MQHRQNPTFDLFVGNLPFSITNDVLMQNFLKFGQINSVVILDKSKDGIKEETKHGYVRFVTEDSLDAASKCITMIDSNKLFVHKSHRTTGKAVVGAGGGGGGGGVGRVQTRRELMKVKSFLSGLENKRDFDNDFMNQLPTFKSKETLVMSHIESPSLFWSQKLSDAALIVNIEKSLIEICLSPAPAVERLEFKKIYAARFSEDSQFYRCEIESRVNDEMVVIRYSDYGNSETLNMNQLFLIPDSLGQLNPLAFKCCLYGVKPSSDAELYNKGTEKLSHLKTKLTKLNAFLYDATIVDDVMVTPVRLETCDGFDVIEVMLKNLMCVPYSRDDWQMIIPKHILSEITQRQQQQQQQQMSLPQHQSQVVPKLLNANSSSFQPKMKIGGGGGGEGGRSEQSNGLSMSEEEFDRLKRENELLKCTKKRFESDLSIAKRQLHTVSGQNSILSVEKLKCMDEIKELKKEHENSSFITKMKKLFSGMQKIQQLRIQFPSNEDAQDVFKNAHDLISKDLNQFTSIDSPLIKDIESARLTYQNEQSKLLALKMKKENIDHSELDKMIKERNEAKRILLNLISEYLEVYKDSEILSFREKQIEKCYKTLSMFFSSYLTRNERKTKETIDIVFANYKAWKEEKLFAFRESRRLTEEKRCEVIGAFGQLMNAFVEDGNYCSGEEFKMFENSFSEIPDIDKILDEYQSSVENEHHVTNQVTFIMIEWPGKTHQ